MPADLYELLGWPRWNPDRAKLLQAIRAAYAELLPYQNHEDRQVAERAMRIQMELGRAAEVLSDPAKFRAYQVALCARPSPEETHGGSDPQRPTLASDEPKSEPAPSPAEHVAEGGPTEVSVSQPQRTVRGAAIGRRLLLAGGACVAAAALAALGIWLRTAPEPLRQTLVGHASAVTCLEFSPDGSQLATGGEDQTVKLWEVATGKLRRTLRGHQGSVTSLAFSADGSLLVSASEDRTVKVWDAATGDLRRTLEGHQRGVTSVAFGPAGFFLASASNDGVIRLWDASRGRLRRTLAGHKGGVAAVAFSPDGSLLASGGDDKTVRLWDLGRLWDSSRGEAPSVVLGEHQAGVRIVIFKDDATLLSAGWDPTVRLWSVAREELRQTMVPPGMAFTCAALSPDGSTVALGNEDKMVTLWDVATGEVRGRLAGLRDRAMCVAFNRDGSLLAAGAGTFDRAVKLWDVGPGVSKARPHPPAGHCQERFLEALKLIHQQPPEYSRALDLLEQNLCETPGAEDIDYDYVWAAICSAHLGKFDDAFEHYAAVYRRFSGGPRKWDAELAEVKRTIAAADDPKARQVRRQILDLEKNGRQGSAYP
jgi:WD40 repeat protein